RVRRHVLTHTRFTSLFSLLRRRPPRATPFPYTTLFRSLRDPVQVVRERHDAALDHRGRRVEVMLRAIVRQLDIALPSHVSRSTPDRKSTRLNSSHVKISYAVFCLKKKKYLAAGGISKRD